MKGTRGTAFFFVALVAGAAWWFFSGGYGSVQNVVAQTAATVVKLCVPRVSVPGAKFKELPPYPPERAGTQARVHWATWGTGEFAQAFRNCEATGNECEFNTGAPRNQACAGSATTTINRVGSYYWIAADSGVTGAAGSGGPPRPRAFAGIIFKAGSATETLPTPPGKLPEPTSPQKPKYQEL